MLLCPIVQNKVPGTYLYMLEQYLLIIVSFCDVKAKIQLAKEQMNHEAPQKRSTFWNSEWLKNQVVGEDFHYF